MPNTSKNLSTPHVSPPPVEKIYEFSKSDTENTHTHEKRRILAGLTNVILTDKTFKVHHINIGRGVVSGLLICGIVFFLAKALESGQASVVIPIAQMSFVVTALLAWLFWGEKLSRKAITGMILACVSIILLSITCS